MHFEAGNLPPVSAFWSLTICDAESYWVANELNSFAIGDRDRLTYNTDGSLGLYVQHSNPGSDRESNWLRACGIAGDLCDADILWLFEARDPVLQVVMGRRCVDLDAQSGYVESGKPLPVVLIWDTDHRVSAMSGCSARAFSTPRG